MIIDGLRPDPRRPGSIRVLVGGKPAWTVPLDVISGLGLIEGGIISSEASEQLDLAADEEGALRSALRMLERRAHSRRELGRKLRFKGHGPAAVDAALARLDRLGLIDDAAFAEAYVAARAGRGRGPARLRRDLEALGVAPEAVAAALGTLESDDTPDPWQRTLEQATSRAEAMRGLPRDVRQRRLSNFFARRGFSDETSRAAIRELIGAGKRG